MSGPANPAQLSAELSGLFPASVVAAELTGPADRSLLTVSELQSISHCSEKRIQDFTRGRACARRALGELSIWNFSLLAGAKREPIWPEGIAGSITHTAGFAAAAAARRAEIASVGLDCEIIESVNEELWCRICTTTEQARLARVPIAERGRQAALIFAAKEAFYKCQFPVSRQWVGFEDVDIEPTDWPGTAGSFRILPQKDLPVSDGWVASLICRFQFRNPWVIAGVTALI
jgi:enterobactin synthetase component D / holo-[acyl-carrier protein] synthase